MKSSIFKKASFLSLFLLVVLLPIFFLPYTRIPIEVSKGLFLVLGLTISIIFWLIARFFDGKISLPKSFTILAFIFVVLACLISALFSKALSVSFFGILLDIGTFYFILASFVLMLLSSIVFKELRSSRLVLFGLTISSIFVIIFQFLRWFLPNLKLQKILSFGVLLDKPDNIFGSLNALAIFAGFSIVSSLFFIEFFSIKKYTKLTLGVFAILFTLFIAIVNFVFVWEILGIFALFIFIYKLSVNVVKNNENEGEEKKTNFPTFSFVIVLVSLFFIILSPQSRSVLPNKLGVINNENNFTVLSTLSIAKSVLGEHPILGIGPNRFSQAWSIYKPREINNTLYWDSFIESGSGVLPTLVATTGLIGILAWLIFFLLFILTGVKWFLFSIKNNTSLEAVTFFFLSLYLFISSFFYFTGTVLFLLAFVFAGIFIGLISNLSKNGEISVSFFNDRKKSFLSILFLVLIMIISAAAGFKYTERFTSVHYFYQTLSANNLEDAEVYIKKALALNYNDLYLRTYSKISILKMNSVISQNQSSLGEADKSENKSIVQASFNKALASAELATTYSPKNYLNFEILGSVYQTAGVFDKALEAYQKAGELNPQNPKIKLIMSNIYNALNKKKEAKDYANLAILLKPDYVDALLTLSQIAKSESDINTALTYAEKALSLLPSNKDLVGYVEFLKRPQYIPSIPESTPILPPNNSNKTSQ